MWILAISGSLRVASTDTAVLRAAALSEAVGEDGWNRIAGSALRLGGDAGTPPGTVAPESIA